MTIQYPHVREYTNNDGCTVGYAKDVSCHELEIMELLLRCPALRSYFCLPFKISRNPPQVFFKFEGHSLNLQSYEVTENGIIMAVWLLRCVVELHAMNVAHLDLKRSNLVWNPVAGTLKLLDFSSSIYEPDHSVLLDDDRGTPGLRDPLIFQGLYNPYKADAWAVGYMITEMVADCGTSAKERHGDLVQALTRIASKMVERRLLPKDALNQLSWQLSPSDHARRILEQPTPRLQ